MVNIIKKGTLPETRVYTGNCRSCKTQFTFERREAQYHSDQRDGDYLSITCPLEGCGKTVTVATQTFSNKAYWA